jgi:hypothetical protein
VAKPEEEVKSCDACGATVYPEHIKKQTADFWMGKLLCPHCLQQKKLLAAVNPAAAYAEDRAPVANATIALAPVEEPDEESAGASTPSGIRAFGAENVAGAAPAAGTAVARIERLRRALLPGSPGATRCRTFHCKLNDASIAYMNDQINEWADASDDIQVKFATSCIGVIEGKHVDPHLIVTVFY